MLNELDVSIVRGLLVGDGQLLQSPGYSGEHGAEVVDRESEQHLGGEVLQLLPPGLRVSGLAARVQKLADLPQQQLHVHRLVILHLQIKLMINFGILGTF